MFRKFGPLMNEQLGYPIFVPLQSDNLSRRKRLGLYVSIVFVTTTLIGSRNKFTT